MLDPRLQLPFLLALTALALLFAWQARPPFTLDLGAPNDGAYLDGFHGGETAAGGDLTYRWTRERATIFVPGYGATGSTLTLRLGGGRPGGAPPPAVVVTAGEGAGSVSRTFPLVNEPRDYELPIPPGAFRDGALRVTLQSLTFRPPADPRDLGLIVDRVGLRDAGAPHGLIAPPLRVLLPALLSVLAAYLAVFLLLRSPVATVAAGGTTAFAFVLCAVRSRPDLALFGPTLASIVAAVATLTGLLAAGLWAGRERWGWGAAPRALGGAALTAGATLLALLAGMRHPQFRSSDLMLNVHRLEFVQRGDWVFALPLPGPRALEAPYPPAFYAAMLPFAALVRDKALLVEVTAALAVAAGALLTFVLARRVGGEDGSALWAAGAYAVAPIGFMMASAGNFANLFGQALANLFFLALVLTWGRWQRPAVAAGLTALLAAATLGHFGVALALAVALPLLAGVLMLRGQEGRRAALALAAIGLAALALAWALYYRHHADLLLGHVRDFLGGETNARGGEAARRPLANRLAALWGGALKFWGWPALPLALAGAWLLRRARPSPPLAIVLAWLASVPLFALIEVGTGLSVRFHLFVLPAGAVAAGWALARLWGVHRLAGPALCLALGALWLWQGLGLWIDRVLHAYH